MKLRIFLPLIMGLALLVTCKRTDNQAKSEPYTWKNVQIVGGGFVDGVIFHPVEKNLRYARTDMGGAYRWDEPEQRWIPILDWLSYEDLNLMGVESIALDPNNPDKVFLSCGTYTAPDVPNGAVLVSSDRGKTFSRTDMPFKMGGNENGRGNGERMAVDPANGNIVYLGTRNDGLWRTNDGGKNWVNVSSFPNVTEIMPEGLNEWEKRRWGWSSRGSGIIFVVFDPQTGSDDGCQTIYVGVSLINRENLFRSNDGGKTWSAIPGQPVQYRPTHGILAGNGMLYLSYGDTPGPSQMTNGGVWKLNTRNGKWTDITPDKPNEKYRFGYAAVSVDASNPDVVIASTHYRPGEIGGDEIFRTTDAGKTWKAVFANGTEYNYAKAPYVQHTGIHWMFDIEINPFNPDHAIFTTGFGGFETCNLTNVDQGLPTQWSVYSTGIEETVPLELLSPPEGAQLVTAIGDYGGFVHWDLDQPAPEGNFLNPRFGNTDGVACAEKKPEILVRVGVQSGHGRGGQNIAWSENKGKTWQPAGMPEENSAHGHIAVSADGETWVWTPQRSKPWTTRDKGNNWTRLDSLPENTRVVADKVNPQKFYAISLYEGLLYTSTDGAGTFSPTPLHLEKGIIDPKQPRNIRGDSRGGQDRIYTTPGRENDLWIAAFDGLYHSPKAGSTFTLMPKVSQIHGFGFGKAAPGKKYPALYLIGIVDGVRGIYRSTDQARNWTRINDDRHQWGLLLHVTGDPKKYGRVYVGTHG
ncbi:MAG TPA: hypothetical protein PLK12_07105, partial [Prolixibacteraceae bacterium]|nr:hypothetical protein [Prolixibacteraceae bacterium]